MAKSYRKICDYCKQEIEMSNKGGKWLPYNLNNGQHDCRTKEKETKQETFTLDAILQKLESIGMKIDLDKLMNQK